jgi:RNA polymerase sigma-70 factor (ECF subfamily)
VGVRQAADEDLVRALYAEYAGPLLSFVQRLVDGDRQRAEDVVQETLLRAWQHPEALSGDRVRPWLYTVARNLVISGHRAKTARAPEVPIHAADALVADDRAFDQALLSWQVADALRALSEAHRQVIVELFYRGRSIVEAAAVLGIPAGTVKSRSFYALRALRLVLEERGMKTP